MSVDLEPIDEKGNAPETRIRDYKSATAIYSRLRDDDATNARNRDLVHRLIRGDPPRDQALMEAAGMGDFSNFNPLKAAADTDQAVTTFIGLADATPTLITVKTKYDPKNPARADWERAIAEEYTWLHRERWESYYDRQQTKAVGLVSDGLALNYWPHPHGWTSEVGRPGQFLFPADASTDVAKWDLVCQVEYVSATRLYELLKRNKDVEAAGDKSRVNKAAVEEAIRTACQGGDSRVIGDDIYERFKDNDLHASHAASQEIKLVHYFVREYSGKVSHYVGRADGGGLDFLETHREAFDSMSRCFVSYADGIGTGKLSSLQGIVWRAYPAYYQDAELRNQAHDALRMACIMMMKTGQGANSREIMGQMTFNPVTVLPPGVEPVQNGFSPAALSSIFPLLAENKQLISNNTGGYASHEFSPEGGGRTAREVSLQAANAAQIGGAKVINYYRSESAYHRETFRRLAVEDYKQHWPGAEERNEMLRRLRDRNVPIQALYGVFEVRTMRAIGLGSPAAMGAAFQLGMSKRPFMDAVGQRSFDRAQLASVGIDYSMLDEWLPPTPESRPTEGDRFARFEHDAFARGAAVTPFVDDDPYVHIPVHLGFVGETMQALQGGLIDNRQAVRQLGPTLQNIQAHFAQAQDPQRADVVKAWQKAFSQAGKMFNDLSGQVEQEKAQAVQAQEVPAAQPGQLTPEQQAKLQDADVKRQIQIQDSQTRQAVLQGEAQARIARQDAVTQQQLAHRDLHQANQILDSQPQTITP